MATISSKVSFSPIDHTRDLECSICRDSAEETGWTAHEFDTRDTNKKVQHIFHVKCLTGWLMKPGCSDCPLCRQPVEIKSVVTNENFQSYIAGKNREGAIYAKEANRVFLYLTQFVNIFAVGVLCLHDAQQYDILGVTSTLALYFISANIGRRLAQSLPFSHSIYNEIAYTNNGFSGGLLAALHYLDPLSIRPAAYASTIYAGVTLGINWLYLPSRVNFIPTDGEESRFDYSLRDTVSVVGMASLAIWQAWCFFNHTIDQIPINRLINGTIAGEL